MLSATVYFDSVTRDYSNFLAATAAEVSVLRETRYFRANIGKVKTGYDLINNSRLYRYATNAFGLSDVAYVKGLIRKVLEGDISSPRSLARTLYDRRHKQLATVFNCAAAGASMTSASAVQQITVNNYVEQSLETRVGQDNEGARIDLYFQRMAPQITSTYSILVDDKTLRTVDQTTFGFPTSVSRLNIDVQAKIDTDHLKISDLQNPGKLEKFIERFTTMYDAQNATAATVPPTSSLHQF